MGKLLKVLHKIMGMNDSDLFDRFKHIVKAQAIHEYLGVKEDKKLSLEISLAAEEIQKRMAARDAHVIRIDSRKV